MAFNSLIDVHVVVQKENVENIENEKMLRVIYNYAVEYVYPNELVVINIVIQKSKYNYP